MWLKAYHEAVLGKVSTIIGGMVLGAAIGIAPAGCCEKPVTAEGIVVRDDQGNAYLLKHHIGNTYTVDRLREASERTK